MKDAVKFAVPFLFFIFILSPSTTAPSTLYHGNVGENSTWQTLVPVSAQRRHPSQESGPGSALAGEETSDSSAVPLSHDSRRSLEASRSLGGQLKPPYVLRADAAELETEVPDVNSSAPESGHATPSGPPVGGVAPRVPMAMPRKPRAAPGELAYAVPVSEDARIGDLIFTVPDHRFARRWFEVVLGVDSPVQIERDSGRLYLASRLRSAADVLVKIHNFGGKIGASCPRSRAAQWGCTRMHIKTKALVSG